MILASMTEPPEFASSTIHEQSASTNNSSAPIVNGTGSAANQNAPTVAPAAVAAANENAPMCSPTSAPRPCSFPFAASLNPINNSAAAFQSSMPSSSDLLAAAGAGGTSPILQSLFARIEAEFHNLAQENARLQLENTKLFHRIEHLQQHSSVGGCSSGTGTGLCSPVPPGSPLNSSCCPPLPPSTSCSSVPHSNTMGAMPTSTSEHAHMTHPLLYDHQSGCLVGGTGAVLSPPRLGAGSGNNNNGANVASSILPLGGTVVPPPPAAAASSSGDNKSKLKVAQRTKTGLNKIVSSFKAGGVLEAAVNSGAIISSTATSLGHRGGNSSAGVTCSLVYFGGHSDSVWDLSSSPDNPDVFASASSDRTVKLWAPGVGMQPVYSYTGHQGSVNCARLHPSEPLVISASGDGSVHVWRYSREKMQQRRHLAAVNTSANSSSCHSKHQLQSSGDDDLANDDTFLEPGIGWNQQLEGGHSSEDCTYDSTLQPPTVLKQPEVTICSPPGSSGLTGPVMAAEFLRGSGSSYVVSGGWDQHLVVSDALTGRVLRVDEGHEGSITNVSCARNDALFASSSDDRTFRVWDLNNRKVVFVCEGHSRKVRTAVFCGVGAGTGAENGGPYPHILSASDDSTLKLWDLRNMSSPLISIRANCGINRFSIWPYVNNPSLAGCHSEPQLVACPLDNRSIRIYSLSIASARSRRLASIPAARSSHNSTGAHSGGGNSSNRSIRTNSSGGGGSSRVNNSCPSSCSWHQRMVSAVTWVNGGHALISASIDGSLLQWNLSSLNRHSKTPSAQLLDSISHLNNYNSSWNAAEKKNQATL